MGYQALQYVVVYILCLNITFIFGRCLCSLAVATPVKYEYSYIMALIDILTRNVPNGDINPLMLRQNGQYFAGEIFEMDFNKISLKYFLGYNYQLVNIGWTNGLVPNRWQAITSTNDDQIHWCINASLDLSELKDLSFNSSSHIIL